MGLSTVCVALVGLLVPTFADDSSEDVPVTQPTTATQKATVSGAAIIPIEGAITDITHDSIERRLKYVYEENIKFVIFELDTPGGALGSTLEICDTIKKLRDEGKAVYAWINNQAYSAGTIIALATDGIVMSTRATIGDCQPIMLTGAGVAAVPEEIEAKMTSPLLSELRDSVRRNDYNWNMVLSLIRPEMQIFWVKNTDTGEKRFVTMRERDELFGLTNFDVDESEDGKTKVVKKRKSRHEPVPDSQSETAWKYVQEHPVLGKITQPVVDDRQLLTMKTEEASAYGFNTATLSNTAQIREHFNITGPIERIESNSLESAIEWLASPAVRAVLFLLMLLGAYTELQTPGLGLAGGVALVALVLFLGAPYLAGYTVTWEIAAIVLGVALLAVEIFVIPGFGVAGISGMILIMVGLLASFVPEEPFEKDWFSLPSLPATWTYLKNGLYSIACGLAGSLVGMVLVARYLPKMPLAGRIIAPNPIPEQVIIDDPYEGAAQIGDIGVSEGPLRPSGKARFGAMLVDVVTQGDYIDTGTTVEVVERRGNRVVVRKRD